MALEDKIEAFKKVSETLESPQIAKVEMEKIAPNKERFASLMNTDKQQSDSTKSTDSAVATAEPFQAPSLMDEVKKLHSSVDTLSKLTPDDLKNQATKLIAQLEDVKSQLSTAHDIKPSYQTLLRNRLTHVDESLKVALSKVGVEYKTPEILTDKTVNPLERFLGYLTQGQYQLEHMQDSLELLSQKGKQLTPGDMLAVQIKAGQISQEIELFTSLLNKALESTKTLMNVQV